MIGLGGAANTIKMTPDELARAKEENTRAFQEAKEMEAGREAYGEATIGFADRGKEWLTGEIRRTG